MKNRTFQRVPGGKPTSRLIEPRRFIMQSPEPPLSQAEVRSFVLSHDFPVPWGASLESELARALATFGFIKIRCHGLESHRVMLLRMKIGAGQSSVITSIRRQLRQVVRKSGYNIPNGGLNCIIRRDRIEAEIVLNDVR